MIRTSKLAALIACCAIFAAPAYSYTRDLGPVHHQRQHVREAMRCPVHRNAAGNLVSCDGWRLRSSAIGWDNTCLNLGYLSSQFACSASGD